MLASGAYLAPDLAGSGGRDVTGDPGGACKADVFLLSPEQRDRVLRREGVPTTANLIALTGDDVSSREAFFASIARAIPFPNYFGHNWDAVYDCLTDPSVMPANGAVLVLDGCDEMAGREPEQWAIALKVLREACAFWRPLHQKLTVFLVAPPQSAPDVPLLPQHCLDA